MNNETVKIEETERYQYLMEESIRQFPMACMWMIHCAVCEQILEEQGIEIDANDVKDMKSILIQKISDIKHYINITESNRKTNST